MPKKNMTPEERKAWGAKMKAAREAKKLEYNVTNVDDILKDDPPTESVEKKLDGSEDIGDQSKASLEAQLAEMKGYIADLQAVVLKQQQPQSGIGVGADNNLVGEVEKYLVDPANYPDPTSRLAAEERLKSIAFGYNYELEYSVAISAYKNQAGVNMKEPRFHITLNRVVIDDEGQPTNKRYIARRLVFHEDPEAALVVARDNGLTIDQTNQKVFLDEMRYIRAKDWLFDIFWPKPVQPKDNIKEEVIGGTVVQVFTKNSEDAEDIPFDKLKKAKV